MLLSTNFYGLEYILCQGNEKVILCERGIRTFETAYRNTLDLNAIPMLKSLTHLPVIVDPSHATGISHRVLPVSKAAIAVGAQGLIVEVHPNPEAALSDGDQSLPLETLPHFVSEIEKMAKVMGRRY